MIFCINRSIFCVYFLRIVRCMVACYQSSWKILYGILIILEVKNNIISVIIIHMSAVFWILLVHLFVNALCRL